MSAPRFTPADYLDAALMVEANYAGPNSLPDMLRQSASDAEALVAKDAEIAALRKVARVGTELDNHHAASHCPYCNPDRVMFPRDHEIAKIISETKVILASSAARAEAAESALADLQRKVKELREAFRAQHDMAEAAKHKAIAQHDSRLQLAWGCVAEAWVNAVLLVGAIPGLTPLTRAGSRA